MSSVYVWVLLGLCFSLTTSCKKVSSRQDIDKISALELQIDESRGSGGKRGGEEMTQKLLELGESYEKFAQTYPEAPETPEYLFRAGELYSNDLQDYPKAIEMFKKNYLQYPEHETAGNALFFVGYHYNNSLHDLIQAEKYYQEFLQKYPTHKMAASAQFELKSLGMPVDQLIDELVKPDSTTAQQAE